MTKEINLAASLDQNAEGPHSLANDCAYPVGSCENISTQPQSDCVERELPPMPTEIQPRRALFVSKEMEAASMERRLRSRKPDLAALQGTVQYRPLTLAQVQALARQDSHPKNLTTQEAPEVSEFLAPVQGRFQTILTWILSLKVWVKQKVDGAR